MNSEVKIPSAAEKPQNSRRAKHIHRLKIFAIVLTVLGIGLFSYFVYSVGVWEIVGGAARIGFDGFALILLIYFLRFACRATSWRSVGQ